MAINLDKGVPVVIAAILAQMVAGTVYVWGAISIYVCSYLQNNGVSDATYESTFLVIPINYLMTAIFAFIVTGPLHKVSPKLLNLIGCFLITLSIFLCQFVRSTALILVLYGAFAGIGQGFVFFTPLKCALHYYPDRPGLITGLCFAGLSVGLFLFSELFFIIVNPQNKRPDVLRINGTVQDWYFSNEVAQHFPRALSIMCAILLVLSILSSLLVRNPGKHWSELRVSNISDQSEPLVEKPPSCFTIKKVLKSGIFWKLYSMVMLSSFYGSYIYSVTKPYGLTKNGDDSFNTLALTIAGLVGGTLRFLWSWSIDRWGFLKVGAILFSFIIVVSCTLPTIASTKALYFLWIILSVACDSAILAVFSTASSLAFGIQLGATAMALLFSGIALVLIGGSLASTYAIDQLGYDSFFYGSGVATGIALLLHLCVRTRNLKSQNES